MAPFQPTTVAALLRASLDAIRTEAAALPEPLLVWHPAPGEWSVKEVVGHLIEAERRGFAGRIRIILDARDPALERWDQNAVARARGDDARDAGALLQELTALREEGVALVQRLGPADLGRGGHHPTVGYLRRGRSSPRVGPSRPQPPQADTGKRPGLRVAAHGE